MKKKRIVLGIVLTMCMLVTAIPVAAAENSAQVTMVATSYTQNGKTTVKYNANGGSGAPQKHSVIKQDNGVAKYTLSTKKPKRSGYVFLGWRLFNSNVYGIDKPGQSIAIQTGNATKNTTYTYYAQWQKSNGITTVKYNANGGKNAPGSQSVVKQNNGIAKYTLSTKKPSRSGYKFLGWRLFNSKAYGIDKPGQSITIQTGNAASDTTYTYYAQWEKTEKEQTIDDALAFEGSGQSDYKAFITEWNKLPQKMRQKYLKNGWKVVLTSDMKSHTTNGNVVGLCVSSKKTIYIKVGWSTAISHEIGHALDNMFHPSGVSRYANTQTVIDVYNSEKNEVAALQKDNLVATSRTEYFAAVVSNYCRRGDQLKAAAPQTYRMIVAFFNQYDLI